MTDILHRHRHWDPDQGADLSVRTAMAAQRVNKMLDGIVLWQCAHGEVRRYWRQQTLPLLVERRLWRDAGRAKLALAAIAARRRRELGFGDR